MAKVLVPKKKEEKRCCSGKNGFTLFSIAAVIVIASSAFSWIGLMNIKHHGGKLPWE